MRRTGNKRKERAVTQKNAVLCLYVVLSSISRSSSYTNKLRLTETVMYLSKASTCAVVYVYPGVQ
ncbi:hypothetical protein V5799_005232, partial [Amblyomma americanum]